MVARAVLRTERPFTFIAMVVGADGYHYDDRDRQHRAVLEEASKIGKEVGKTVEQLHDIGMLHYKYTHCPFEEVTKRVGDRGIGGSAHKEEIGSGAA